MTIITIILIAFFLIGAFLPRDFSHSFYDSSGLKIDTLFYFKLGRNELDYRIDNTGDWPDGDWRVQDKKQQRLTYGEPYIDPETQERPNMCTCIRPWLKNHKHQHLRHRKGLVLYQNARFGQA